MASATITTRGHEAAGSSPTLDAPMTAAAPSASRLKPKLRRVSKACGPCSLAHSACDRVRPCKRCVSQGKAHQCVDVSTGRRRGRPRRQSSERDSAAGLAQQAGRAVPKAEFDDEDSHRAGDEDEDDDAGVDAQPRLSSYQHGDDDDNDGEEEGEQDNSDDADDSGDDAAIHVAKRAHTEPRSYSPSLSSFDVMAKLLEEQRNLIHELRAMRAEVAQVRHTQSIHEKHFASIMPLLSTSLASNTSSFSPPSSSSPSSSPPTLRSSHPNNNDDSSSSHSPSSSPLAGDRRQAAGGKRSSSRQHQQPFQPLSSTLLSLITNDAPLPSNGDSALMSVIAGWECPMTAAGGGDGHDVIARQLAVNYVPHLGSDAHVSLPHGTGGVEQRRSRRRRHDEMVLASSSSHQHQQLDYRHPQQQLLPYGSIQAHYLPPRIPGTGLYQKDLLIPSFAYHQMHDALVVPLKVRLEMLSHLPFLSHYNITSPTVPFAITDPRQPIAVCRAAPTRSPGQEIITELVYVSPSFADLARTPQERLLGRSCTNILGAGDDDSMKQFLESLEPWVTMRSTVQCSPVLSGRIMVRRKDDSQVAAQCRMQMFYNEQGYFVQCVAALEAEPWAIQHAVQPSQALGHARPQQPATIARQHERMPSITGATRVNGETAAMSVFPNVSAF